MSVTAVICLQNKDSKEGENGAVSPEDIEVVHSHSPPKLQSILKQQVRLSRTVSESSDDAFSYSRENSVSCAGSETPISESDEPSEVEASVVCIIVGCNVPNSFLASFL